MTPKPTMLLLHGGPGGDHSGFRPWFDRFADTYQVIYLDHRGQGRSDGRHDPTGWNLDTWADDVVRFCDALEIEHPVVCGTSFGGFVAMHYAARHADHPSKLILVSTQARRFREITAARFEELGGPEARAVYEQLYGGGPTTLEMWAEYASVCLPLYNTRPSTFGPRRSWANVRVLQHFNAEFFDMDLRSDLAAVRCPTLVLCGANDPMTPPEASEEIAALLPAGLAHLEVFAQCGHGTYRDQPEQSERAVREFLLG
jgi:proline iminopeptidase